MQHPLYLGHMLPHMALPDAPINYYPYVYPPPFALGNPHLLPPEVPTPSNAKTDRGPVDAERNVNRTADSDTRSRYYAVCCLPLSYVDTLRLIGPISYPGECDLMVHPRKYSVIFSQMHFVTLVYVYTT